MNGKGSRDRVINHKAFSRHYNQSYPVVKCRLCLRPRDGKSPYCTFHKGQSKVKN